MEDKTNQPPLFSASVTEGLRVNGSRRRLDRMARDASVNPNAYEASALAAIERRKKYRKMAAEERARYNEELEELNPGNKHIHDETEEKDSMKYNSDSEVALQTEISMEEGKRALTQNIPLADLYITGLHFLLQDDEESERLGSLILDKAKNFLQTEEPSIERPTTSFTYITYTKMRVYDEKGKEPSGKERKNEGRRILAAGLARLRNS